MQLLFALLSGGVQMTGMSYKLLKYKMKDMRCCKMFLLLALAIFLCGGNAKARNYTVTCTADTGAGSLRQAITDANSSFGGGHTISFDIPLTDPSYDSLTGTFVIHLRSELPYFLITGNITIDGTTQATSRGNTNPLGPEVVVTCDTLNLMSCFRVASAGITIKGLVIGGFQYGVLMFGANGGRVSDCYIGVAPDGRTPFPNTYGIGLSGGTYGAYNLGYSRNVTIADNVISGNTSAGIVMDGSGTRNNVVVGNRIGVSALGDSALSNHYGIIIMTNANSNRIGGNTAAERNIISANEEIGIYIESADSNTVCGNYIGTDITGTYTFEYAPDSSIQANGVEINTTGRHNLIGGSTLAERNIISGNRVYGCIYYGNCSQNNIAGNYIGTDVTGTQPIPNATGICVDGSSNHNIMENNVLSGNRSYGLFIVTRGTDANIFRGNKVGTDATGTQALPNDVGLMLAADAKDNVIGGNTTAARNIFSGNTYAGIEVTDAGTENNIISGNYIGVDSSGNDSLPNGNGIIVSALVKHLGISNNVISSNRGYGLVITDRADSNVVEYNKIGVGANGFTALGNGAAGLVIGGGATNNVIGGTDAGNIIAYNDSVGIVLTDAATQHNKFTENRVFENRYAGIYFMDAACNGGIRPPIITFAGYNQVSGYSTVSGTVSCSNPQNAVVEVFLADTSNGLTFFPQGRFFGMRTNPDAQGHWSVSKFGGCIGTPFVATVTDADGNTSMFSNCSVSVLGVENVEKQLFNVLPNPTNGVFVLSNAPSNARFEVYSITGKHLFETTDAVIDLSSFPQGVYFLTVYENDIPLGTSKIIKQ